MVMKFTLLFSSVKPNTVPSLNQDIRNETRTCVGCAKGKMSRSPFKSRTTRAEKPAKLIHSDVCGPMHVISAGGSRYYVSFKDDHTGWTTIYFMKQKSEVSEHFKNYVMRLKTEKGLVVDTLRTDNGGEYVSNELKSWMQHMGIRHEKSAPYTPQQSGVAERYNRTLMECARCIMYGRNVPLLLWAEAVQHANYLKNRVPYKGVKTTPYESWMGEKPDISHLKVVIFSVSANKTYLLIFSSLI